MNQTLDSTTVITAMPLGILPLAAVLALLASLGLLKLYRRVVLRSMGTSANSPSTEPVLLEASAPTDRPVQATPDFTVLGYTSSLTARATAETLHSTLLRAPWRAAAIYTVAGACYAFVLAVSILMSGSLFSPFRLLVLFWVYAWPVVLTVNLVAATSWRARLASASVYFLVLAVLGGFGSWIQVGGLWLLVNLPPTILLLAFLNRRVRAVGPLMLTFMVLAITGSFLAPAATLSSERLAGFFFDLGWALGLGAEGISIGPSILSFTVFGVAGWLALRWIRGRYERKKTSDQSITLDAIFLMFAIVHSFGLVFEGIAWILSGLVAFVVYKIVVRAGFSLLGRKSDPAWKSPKLLLLRVFSLGKRSERLFDALGTHWRHVGSIQLIAGPDLATTTVEPHEFLDFLNRKLARRFIDGPQTLDLRISEMDIEPDRDGRFRVNDFFCHEDTWKMVLSRLVSESDAVLMDIRGFSPKNAGVRYEIEELINVIPLERVVFVIDDTTDEQFLRQTVQQSWDRMRLTSPNRSSTSGQLRLFRFTRSRSGELQQLLHTLCVATSAAPQITMRS